MHSADPHCYLYSLIIFCLIRDVKHYTDLIKIGANQNKGGNKANIDETGFSRIISVIQPKKLTIFSHFNSSCDIPSVASDHAEELKCKCVIRTLLETRRLCLESLETGANSWCQKSDLRCCDEAHVELTSTYHIRLVLLQSLPRDKSSA